LYDGCKERKEEKKMSGKKNVKGKGYTCKYCGKSLDYVWFRSGVQEKNHFCCQDHSTLWRKQVGFYVEMGKGRAKATAEYHRQEWMENGHFKKMSEAGKAGRSRAIPISNREKPRRRKHL